MEHVVSTTSVVFPTTCRNYYDPYQQKSMAPSTKTYTISNGNNRRSKKIDNLNLVRSDPPDFRSNPPVVAVPHRLRTPASTPAVRIVLEPEFVPAVPHRLRQPASSPAVKISPERDFVPAVPNSLQQPASAPAAKPAPPAVTPRLRQPASVSSVRPVPARESVPIDAPAIDPKSIPRPSNKPSIRQMPPPPPPTPRSGYKPSTRQVPPPPPPPTPVTRPSDRSSIKQVPPPPPSPRTKPTPKSAPKPVTKPAPAMLTPTYAPESRYKYQRELQLPFRDDLSPEYSPTDPGILNRDSPIPRPRSKSRPAPRPTPRADRPQSKERQREKRPSAPTSKPQSSSLFSFACFRPRQKTREKPTPSFKVLNSKLSDYETIPSSVSSKAKKPQIPSQDTPVARYRFLYPKIPDNIPGTAGINSIPSAKLPRSKYQQLPQQQPQVVPLPPRRVVKKLSTHLSHHPAVKSLVYQYPAVEMYEKRTGFDSYFDSPFVEYSHSYWTAALHRPPSPFKKTKPLKVKFETPTTPASRLSSVETYGGKADLGARCELPDSYSYPYSPEDYYRKSDFGTDRTFRETDQKHRAVKPQSGETSEPRARIGLGVENLW